VRGSIRSVDLASSRIFAAQVLEASPLVENKIDDKCCAEFPEEFAVLDGAMASVVQQAEQMYLPWSEVVPLYYFDDKDCGLNNAFNRHKAGDIQGALEQSLANLERCNAFPRPNPKVLGHANHNVGMGYFALGQHEKALEYLEEAQRIKPGDIFAEAIAQCRRAAALARDMQRVEERATFAAGAADQRVQAAEAATAADRLTNADIMAMVKAKLPTVVILAKIKNSPCKFDTRTNALIALSEAGVPADVLTAIMDCGKK
jgi:tetratricopeptide (TPR) repeat protein